MKNNKILKKIFPTVPSAVASKKYFLILLAGVIAACNQTTVIKSPAGYDLTKPVVYNMPEELNEISGITFKNGNPDTIYTVQDEKGELIILHPGDSKTHSIKFAKKGDYEDVSLCNGIIIILRSDGKLLTFLSKNAGKEEAVNMKEFKELLPRGEYESMYADEKTNMLYVLCKDCYDNKKRKLVNGYTFKIDSTGTVTAGEAFFIDEKEVEDLSNIKKVNLKASAMAKNNVTQEWYIVSAVNKLLVVTDARWKVKETYILAPTSLFTQPEGIGFDSSGNLYISNEKGAGNAATILKFPYKHQQ